MEYTQLTLIDWIQVKEDIRRKLQETAENFVYIGYKLRQIDEGKTYLQDKCENIYEFAKKEYGLERTVTSRFMAINAKFSIGGNSTELQEQYKNLGSSKLQEMLNLTDEECQLITERTTVREIRDLKNLNRQQASEEAPAVVDMQEKVYTALQKCIIDFFSKQERRETLNATLKMSFEGEMSEEVARQQAELINPSEYATHIKGVIYLFLYEYDRGVAYKNVTQGNITKLSWIDFISEIAEIYRESYGPDTWSNFYGPVLTTIEPVKEEKKAEKPKNTESEPCATSHKKKEEKAENEKKPEVEKTDTEPEKEELCAEESEREPEDDVQQSAVTTDEHPGREYTDDEQGGASENASDSNAGMCTPVDGSIVKNPYYELQAEAKGIADSISETMSTYRNRVVPAEEMNKVLDEVTRLAAVVEQMTVLEEDMK